AGPCAWKSCFQISYRYRSGMPVSNFGYACTVTLFSDGMGEDVYWLMVVGAPGGTALISLLARIRSSMLDSSTTTRSASSGLSRSKDGSPPGRSCSSRCTVVAGCPDSSVNRFAARPVGAASTIFARFAAASVMIDLAVNDLPQPGPPGSTATLEVGASRAACSWFSANSAPVRGG